MFTFNEKFDTKQIAVTILVLRIIETLVVKIEPKKKLLKVSSSNKL